MGAQESADKANRIFNIPTILLALIYLLPGIVPILFGWVTGLLAIPIFCLLILYGEQKSIVIVRNGSILAIIGAAILNLLPGTIFSLTLIPLGFSLSRSAQKAEDEIQTAYKGLIVLGISWLVYWIVFGTIQGSNPYSELLKILDTGFAQTYEIYKNNSDIPVDTLIYVERVVSQVRIMIPKILPGILICTLLITVWLNLLGSITVLDKLKPGSLPWKKYSEWRLPDKVIWIPIIAGFAWAIGKGPVNSAGISLILVSTLLYFFQGLAILIYFIDRWNIPLYMKILIYGILIFQSYGLLMLSIAGIADVWLDFRKIRDDADQSDG